MGSVGYASFAWSLGAQRISDRSNHSLSLSLSLSLSCMLAAITRPLYQVHCPDRLLNKPRTPSFQDLIVIYGYSFPPSVLVSSFEPCPSLGGILSSPLELFAVEGREIRPCHLWRFSTTTLRDRARVFGIPVWNEDGCCLLRTDLSWYTNYNMLYENKGIGGGIEEHK